MQTTFYQTLKINDMKNFEDNNSSTVNDDKLPTFPDSLYPQLPQFLQDAVSDATTNQERDMLLLGAITSISSCLPNIYGIYGDELVYSNLYFFLMAPPASGKSKLNKCRLIINPVDKYLKGLKDSPKDELLKESEEFRITKDSKDKSKTSNRMLFLPANNTSSGMLQLLYENEGEGIIFETEGDTLSLAFKTEHGNYSDSFRKAFQHEPISYYRKTDREYVEIEFPRLSVVLSGTWGQIKSLIPEAENGLFSRFIFYSLNSNKGWNDPYKNSKTNSINLKFENLGIRFLEFYKLLNQKNAIKINVSDRQSEISFKFFEKTLAYYEGKSTTEFTASIKRLGLISYRFAMIFSALRIMEDENFSEERVCSDVDFKNVLDIVEVLIKQSHDIYSTLPNSIKPVRVKSIKEQFFASLPKTFDRQSYLDIAEKYNITQKTADRYIYKAVASNLILKPEHNNYINTLIEVDEEVEDIKETKDIINTDESSPESSTSLESP